VGSRHALSQAVTNVAARFALRHPSAERLLQAGVRSPVLRRHLRLGAIAMGYPRVLRGRALRVAELDGYRVWVNVAEPLGIDPYFFGRSGTAWITPSLLRPGDLCVDAGANAGHYTFLCATVVGRSGRVFSFEPNPEFAELLRRSVELNGYEDRVEVKQLALWAAKSANRAFHVSDESSNTGTSSLVEHGWFPAGSHVIGVQTTTLDDVFVEAGSRRIRFIKIDVERAEDAVLAGARMILAQQQADYFIVELHKGSRAEQLLREAGYEGYLLEHQHQRLAPLHSVSPDTFGDFLFARPGLSLEFA
jgi:FkbM family methyltransferase